MPLAPARPHLVNIDKEYDMNRKKTLLALAVASGSLMGLASVAQATPAVVAGTVPYTYGGAPYGSAPVYGGAPVYNGQVMGNSGYAIQSPPPAPIVEAVPTPRAGQVWAPGYYTFENGRYMWHGGAFVEARPGYAWQAAHWQQHADGSWYLQPGHWVRGDGYAQYDNGRRGPYGDRDGDGVINRDDRYPRDPNHY
jgi:hypothetical protein